MSPSEERNETENPTIDRGKKKAPRKAGLVR
jgi:hypothetical protein